MHASKGDRTQLSKAREEAHHDDHDNIVESLSPHRSPQTTWKAPATVIQGPLNYNFTVPNACYLNSTPDLASSLVKDARERITEHPASTPPNCDHHHRTRRKLYNHDHNTTQAPTFNVRKGEPSVPPNTIILAHVRLPIDNFPASEANLQFLHHLLRRNLYLFFSRVPLLYRYLYVVHRVAIQRRGSRAPHR